MHTVYKRPTTYDTMILFVGFVSKGTAVVAKASIAVWDRCRYRFRLDTAAFTAEARVEFAGEVADTTAVSTL